MGQPSGRILRLPAKYRTYLRCSPVICAADTVSILLHLFFYLKYFPLKETIKLLISERFGDDEKGEEGIQAIENVTFVRWLFFVFGTAGPAIKLMAMEGILWTKAWGAMFLTSFLVVEILVVLSWIYESHEPRPEAQESRIPPKTKGRLRIIDMILLVLSSLFYAIVLFWAAIDVYCGLHPPPFEVLLTPPGTRFPPTKIFFVPTILGFHVFSLLYIVMIVLCIQIYPTDYLLLNPNRRSWKFQLVVWLAPRFCVLVVLGIYGPAHLNPHPKQVLLSSLYSWIFIIILSLPCLAIWIFLGMYAEAWPRFSRSVFITWKVKKKKEANGTDWNPRLATPLNFAMFLYTTMLTVIWYCYRYNPEGTVNRGWTGVFG